MHFLKIVLLGLLPAIVSNTCKKNKSINTKTFPAADKHWQFEAIPVWSDEFNINGKPNTTKWNYDVGGNG